jgi:hypothetical protein
MRPRPVVLCVLAVLSSICLAQWSEPVCVGDSTGYRESFQLAAGGGDTLWAFYVGAAGVRDTVSIFSHCSMGDSWSDPQALNLDIRVFNLSAGVDARRRVWLAWYDGGHPTLHDTWGIYTRVHDSLGWGNVRLALPMGGMSGLSFAADKHGAWYMGIYEAGWDVSFALCSRLEGDTWTEPEYIAVGLDSIGYSVPTLVARPDTGLWAVYSRYTYATQDMVVVDHLIPDSTCAWWGAFYNVAGWAATGDSAGQLWFVYVDTLGAVRSITCGVEGERRRQLVTTDHRWSAPQVCTDAMGWVWAFWSRSDTSLVVSCNWGNNWSEPEVVTSMNGYPEDIVSDQQGRIYVGFYDLHGRYWTCYRTSRPGVGGDSAVKRPAVGHRASVVRTPPREVVMFDAMGRRVLSPRSGVLFVLEPSAAGGGRPAVRKVVIQR